ncbi:hypothetical protein BV20DRAFT_1058530 [Pilatotrama ljubarskyi]|nr:hypothetical protein BV20DRAFT_1058530 [Pilatotrama ljubarskyi]
MDGQGSSSEDDGAESINTWPAILTLVLFFVSIPLASVLLLLAAGVFDGQTIRDGVVGTSGVQPLNIMALFISLAYISISLDATGLFRFLAFWVASKGGRSGRRLFAYLYLFFLICGVIVGNDPVILSGTAFLAYFTRVAGITPPTAWVFSQFAAANMASVVLVSSNPTNLVLSGAFSLSFLTYAAHVALPFLAVSLSVFPLLLFWLFRSPALIPPTIDVGLTQEEVHATLVDKSGAVFGSALLAVTLGVLVGVSTVGVPVWTVTVPPAVIMLGRDAWYDWRRRKSHVHPLSPTPSASGEGDPVPHIPSSAHELHELSSRVLSTPRSLPPTSPPPTPTSSTARALLPLLRSVLTCLTATFPTVAHIAARLPIALLPFAFLMFILVQGLAAQGWVALFARWWDAWVGKTGALGAVGGMGFLACVMCNDGAQFCGTNIGATILLARVLQLWLSPPAASPSASHAASARARDGAIYALALGSNFGAFTLTFGASLAGLLWRQILRQKGIRVRGAQFALLNLPISVVAMAAGCAVLVGQLYVEHREG